MNNNDWNLVYPFSEPVIEPEYSIVLVQEYIEGVSIYIVADVPKVMYANEASDMFKRFPETMFAWKYTEFGPDINLPPVNKYDLSGV